MEFHKEISLIAIFKMTTIRFILVTIAVIIYLGHSLSIPRACSTLETLKYPFCNHTLPIEARIDDLISRLSPEDYASALTARTSKFPSELGIPDYDWGANCIHGVKARCGTNCPTLFPMPNGIGASWNPSLAQEMAQALSTELRALYLEGVGENKASGLPHIGLDCWSPTINIMRDPRWGRNQEVFSEDPLITSQFGLSYTKGMQQGSDSRYLKAAVTLKHFTAYSLENTSYTDRLHFNALISEYDLWDSYLPAFKTTIQEGNARGVMCALNAVNNAPACASERLGKILREDWGFTGYVSTDSAAILAMAPYHHFTNTTEEAVVQACMNIVDICSGPSYQQYLGSAMKKGWLKQIYPEKGLRNSLRVRFELGLFDPIDDQPYWNIPPQAVNSKQHQELNLKIAEQSLVLLRNDNDILPLSPGTKVSVIGPHSNSTDGHLGNYLGQICPGHYEDYSCIPTMEEEITKINGAQFTTSSFGSGVLYCSNDMFEAAAESAVDSKVLLLMLGIDLTVEGETRDRVSIQLPGCQLELVSFLAKRFPNLPLVVVLFHGGTLSLEFLDQYENVAVLDAFYPGFQGATAAAKTLFGENNPGGKLPSTLYPEQYTDQINVTEMSMVKSPGRGYRYYQHKPVYPFGWGLSYTLFDIQVGLVNLIPLDINNPASASFRINVCNLGSRQGDEVVQIYSRPENVLLKTPLRKKLLFFHRVSLQANTCETLDYVVRARDLSYLSSEGVLYSSPGEYSIIVTNGVDSTDTLSVNVVSPLTELQLATS